MIEISGQESKIEAFIDLMRPIGIVELVRTGRIAMVRGKAQSGATKAPLASTKVCDPQVRRLSRTSASAPNLSTS